MIPFNVPLSTGRESEYLNEVMERNKFTGGGKFHGACQTLIREQTGTVSAHLTTSASHSLEIAALLLDLKEGDEVIVPSFAFPTSASSFVRNGSRLVFVDIDPLTMNISPEMVLNALSSKTKAVVVLHYAGVSCDMDALLEIARENDLWLIEDAAQAIYATYKNKACGTLGDFGCFSFHQSKNIHCGEGGAFLCNRPELKDEVEMIIEKGSNRNLFEKGEVDKYTWQRIGSSYVLSELNSAFLLAQLENGHSVTDARLKVWQEYESGLKDLSDKGFVQTPFLPEYSQHNGHMFWLKVENKKIRDRLISHLRRQSIYAVFHYQPLHSSPAGLQSGQFSGEDRFTTIGADCLLRIPLYYGFDGANLVTKQIYNFFGVSQS